MLTRTSDLSQCSFTDINKLWNCRVSSESGERSAEVKYGQTQTIAFCFTKYEDELQSL